MSLTDLANLLANNGMGIAVAIYFMLRDWKMQEKRIEADLARAAADSAQTEVMRELKETVQSLQQLITNIHKDDI